jgi:hypothetical protein
MGSTKGPSGPFLLADIKYTVKYTMEYKLYTTVDITHTGQFRNEPGRDIERWQEQNFNTVLQTIGIRANITYRYGPEVFDIGGKACGFEFDHIARTWRFDFYTEQDFVFEADSSPVGHLKEMFDGVPYIADLTEQVQQNYAVFVTDGPSRNIVFHQK